MNIAKSVWAGGKVSGRSILYHFAAWGSKRTKSSRRLVQLSSIAVMLGSACRKSDSWVVQLCFDWVGRPFWASEWVGHLAQWKSVRLPLQVPTMCLRSSNTNGCAQVPAFLLLLNRCASVLRN